MATVNFQCGHCGNLMAVSVEHLGQQVRCPHCQQVVLAPNTSAPAAPAPAPAPAPVEDHPFRGLQESEDIFHRPSETEDALFGSEEPRLEMPRPESLPEPAPAPAPVEAPQPAPTYMAPSPQPESPSPAAETPTEAFVPAPGTEATAPWVTSSISPEPTVAPAPVSTGAPDSVRRVRDTGSRINWFIPLVFIPLVLYSVLVTAAVGILYIRLKTQPPSIFEQMPDEGDTPGVRKTQKNLSFNQKQVKEMKLPDPLRVKLGKTLQIGELEVTPTKVERRKVRLLAEGAEENPEPSKYDALVLHLELRNKALDYAFTPLDNYFDRKWDRNESNVPLTSLKAKETTFFGGPAKWLPLKRPEDAERREWLEGRKNVDREGLAPGASMKSIVATDGWDPKVQEFLFGLNENGRKMKEPYSGALVWRVRVRRGLVEHKGREVSATAVIGVEFTDKDYAEGKGG